MQISTLPTLGLAVMLAAGCASQPLSDLRGAERQGSALSRALSTEYQHFATIEFEQMLDFKDADHFANKGLVAARGGSTCRASPFWVMPTPPALRRIIYASRCGAPMR